jgi:iron complex transport system ATP-binding protein
LTPDLLGRVFGVEASVETDPARDKPICRITGLIKE